MFFESSGTCYRLLAKTDSGAWVIVYGEISEPQFVSNDCLEDFKRIETPKDFVSAMDKFECGALTKASQERFRLIEPVLSHERYIWDKKERRSLLEKIAAENNTTYRRLNQIFLRFLATGTFICQRKKKDEQHKSYEDIFLYVIKKYYFSAKQLSLKDTYCIMKLAYFTAPDGKPKDDTPSLSCFRKFYFSHGLHRSTQKEISRNGILDFQRNNRLLYGSAMRWREKIGSYQMDATTADIFLVSRFGKLIIGRPNIYLAVDTATQLIAGFYVGLDSGETAVMACLRNAAEDKVNYCKRYGISIEPWQWPSHGIPSEIITDKGREFTGKMTDMMCVRFGMTCQSLPPFRPDGKGLVEKAFDLLQQRYKPLLRGKGVIGEDVNERWSTDYRTQAVLNLDDFTQVLIHCIIYLNSGRILQSFEPTSEMAADNVEPIAAKIWEWYEQHNMDTLLDVDDDVLRIYSIPSIDAKVTRKGIQCCGLWYSSKELSKSGIVPGDTVTIAYDPQDVGQIFILYGDRKYQSIPLAKGNEQYFGISFFEYKLFQESRKGANAELQKNETLARMTTIQQITQIANRAGAPQQKKITGAEIQENRKTEKERHT